VVGPATARPRWRVRAVEEWVGPDEGCGWDGGGGTGKGDEEIEEAGRGPEMGEQRAMGRVNGAAQGGSHG
jgi:hypothetical protein